MDEKALTEFMQSQGFERLEDYNDLDGCPIPMDGKILQFYNPATDEGVQFSITPVGEDGGMFGEVFLTDYVDPWKEESSH